ncbi:MAG: rhamnulokinase [Lachnospiraceae bacterium]|nr:rhamnulokinase [Lachnospiraceae bacterium]
MIFLAIDIGASSGRHIAAWRENGTMVMKEVYRFKNGAEKQDGALVWNINSLCSEVVNGLAACKKAGIVPDSIGIDTWGVDYCLLDEKDEVVRPVYCYRDERGAKTSPLVHEITPFSELYERTGIQYQSFNTVYQMYFDKLNGRLEKSTDFLMLPEYLGFFLTGVKAHEYTDCSTSGLVNAFTREWDKETIKKLGLPERLFERQPENAPIKLGKLKKEIADKAGFNADVILPATHDTGSAVASLRETKADNAIYISSGTWSLMGVELDKPLTGEAAFNANFSNEGGIGTVRFLKNIMGLWLVQCLKKELSDKYSFAELAEMAEKEAHFDYVLSVNDENYLAPESVMREIEKECSAKGFPVPKTPGEFAHAIYSSLAHCYKDTAEELEKVTGRTYEKICIIGGGSNNKYLNGLTERITGKKVILGSPEATALGNILLQEEVYVQ